jgi:hypothetical protein
MKRIFVASLFVAGLSIISINAFAQGESRDDVIKQIETKRAELTVLEKKLLVPSEEDRTAYAGFMGTHDKGLIRLLPREVYDGMLAIRGGGSYYSFLALTHDYGRGSDIGLEQGFLKVGFAGADYGMLLNVGDVPLEEINTEHPSVRFLAAYSAVLEEPQARAEQRRFGGGTNIDGVPYSERVRAQVKATYIVRSINYSESDVLVAFRVLRKDHDGSLIIAWKMLKEFSVPDLARNTNQQ